jgi:hypothetical protein
MIHERPAEPFPKEGDMVFYRGRLSRVEKVDECGYCHLANEDGDTYIVHQSFIGFQNGLARDLAEIRRGDF